jgi:hypothetical protein
MIYHDDLRLKRCLAAGGALLTAVVVSVFLYVVRPAPSVQRVIFFPDETTHVWNGELREIPKQKTRELEIEYLTRELILGPTLPRHGRGIPRKTVLESVILRNNALYVGFSEHLVFPPGDMLVGFDEILAGYRKTITYNYPRIDEIRILVDGIEQA